MSVAIRTGKSFEASTPQALFRLCEVYSAVRGTAEFYDVAPDGDRFLASCLSAESKQPSVRVRIDWQHMANGAEAR